MSLPKTKSNGAEYFSKHVIAMNSFNGKGAIDVYRRKQDT